MDDASLSRSGITGPFGKLLVEMPKVRVSEATLAGLRVGAGAEGIPFAEYVRIILDGHVHGPEHVEKVAAERVRRVFGMGSQNPAEQP